MKVKLFCLLFFLSSFLRFSDVKAQREDYLWYFGSGSEGIKFDYLTKQPAIITGKYTPYTGEGCSVVCDPRTGDLLYYSDGIRAIDATHKVMPNGSGLSGNSSSAQNGKSCPVPGTCHKYYVFSNSAEMASNPYGKLYYSIVDMTLPGNGTLSNPLGDIASGHKSILILNNSSEAMTIVRGGNKGIYWLLSPLSHSSKITVFKITSAGITSMGTFDTGHTLIDIRNIRYSEKVKKFALGGMHGRDPLLILDFDNVSGQLSNVIRIPGTPLTNLNKSYYGMYDFEWSASGTKLYFSIYRNSPSTGGRFYQYDFNYPLIPPKLIYDTGGSSAAIAGGLTRGPDDKIYCLYKDINNDHRIGIINDPDQPAPLCNFNYNGLNMGSGFGAGVKFPDFLIYDNNPPVSQNDMITTCSTEANIIIDELNNDNDPDGDPLSISLLKVSRGTAVLLADNTIKYTFPTNYSGNDTVVYILCDNDCHFLCDTAIILIMPGLSSFNGLGNDTSFCEGNTYTLDAGAGYSAYYWKDDFSDSTSRTFIATGKGSYWVQVKDVNGCIANDTIEVLNVYPLPLVDAGKDTAICYGKSIQLNATGASIYKWMPGGEIQPAITVSPASTSSYAVTGYDTHHCGSATDTVIVYVNPKPSKPVFENNYIQHCFEDGPLMIGTNEGSSFFWSTGDTTQSIRIDQEGSYSLLVSDNSGCPSTGEILVKEHCMPRIFVPDAFSPNGDNLHDQLEIFGKYFKNFEIKIFNRWGEIIFISSERSIQWDGTYRGEDMPIGSYPWIIHYQSIYDDEKENTIRGCVTLIR